MTLKPNLDTVIEFWVSKTGHTPMAKLVWNSYINFLNNGGHFENNVMAKRSICKIFYFSSKLGYSAQNISCILYLDSGGLRPIVQTDVPSGNHKIKSAVLFRLFLTQTIEAPKKRNMIVRVKNTSKEKLEKDDSE